jgi:hypothetical protein
MGFRRLLVVAEGTHHGLATFTDEATARLCAPLTP